MDADGYVMNDVGARKPVNTAGVCIHKELHLARPDLRLLHAHIVYGKT
jgi:hypothetical protein